MSAILAMKQDLPRLYSKQPRIPADVIAPQHVEIHADLERWGSWNRERYEAGTCDSLEKHFESGGREVKTPVISLPTNPRNLQLDRAVRHMSIHVPQHGETIKLFYVKRRPPIVICRVVVVHWKDFGTWMFHCRAMVLNVIRALD